jgi:hypothetical protein
LGFLVIGDFRIKNFSSELAIAVEIMISFTIDKNQYSML